MKIYDFEGNERDAAWLQGRYGAVTVRGFAGDSGFRVVELRECIGPAVYVVKVLDEFGQPIDEMEVARHWPDPTLPLLPPNPWYDRGVYGPTNAEGDIGFGSGGGDYYDPTGQMHDRQGNPLGTVGASSFFVLGWDSDCVDGIGTLGGTEHAHLDMVFRWVEGDEPEPPEPPPPPPPPPPPTECGLDLEAFLGAMETALDALQTAMQLVAETHGGGPPPP